MIANMMKKHINWAVMLIVIILAVNIAITSIMFSFRVNVYDKENYVSLMEKHNSYANFPYSKERLNQGALSLVDFLKNGGEPSVMVHDQELLTSREKLHMKEVRELMNSSFSFMYRIIIGIIVFYVTLYFLVGNKFPHYFSLSLMLGAIFNWLIAIYAYVKPFGQFFTNFHLWFFKTDFWLLEPTDTLIKLFPQEFFRDFMIKIMTYSILLSIIIFGVGLYIFKTTPKKEKTLFE